MLAANSSVRDEALTTWLAKLDALSKLEADWDRHGAPPPSETAIKAAQDFVEAMVEDNQPPTRLAGSAVGGVGVTRQIGDRIAYIEFYNDGRACALLADDGPEETVVEVARENGTFRHILNKLRAHLHG